MKKKRQDLHLYIYSAGHDSLSMMQADSLTNTVGAIDQELTDYVLYTPQYAQVLLQAVNSTMVAVVLEDRRNDALGLCRSIYDVTIHEPLMDSGQRYLKFKDNNGSPVFVGEDDELTIKVPRSGGGQEIPLEVLKTWELVDAEWHYSEAVAEIKLWILKQEKGR